MIPYIQTNNALIIHWKDGTPRMVDSEHKNYETILQLVMNAPVASNEIYNEIEEHISIIHKLNRIADTSEGRLDVSPSGVMTFKCDSNPDFTVPVELATHITTLYDQNGNIDPFVKFVSKLRKNPDYRVVNQLWGFIKSCGLCLTPDGNFMAYKNVNENFTSPYDSVTDNSPGTVLEMQRNEVDNNPQKTCSSGLHFAAWGYLQHYASGRKTVLLSISPEDVVSIPVDYNNQKGRACRYTVVREVEQPEELKNIAIFNENDDECSGDICDFSDSYDEDPYCEDCGSDISENGYCYCFD